MTLDNTRVTPKSLSYFDDGGGEGGGGWKWEKCTETEKRRFEFIL